MSALMGPTSGVLIAGLRRDAGPPPSPTEGGLLESWI